MDCLGRFCRVPGPSGLTAFECGARSVMKSPIQFLAISAVLVLAWQGSSCAQSQQAGSSQPLNATVSDYGTTFIFSPPPICPKCVETEFGFQSISDGRYLPTVITVAPFKTQTDFSV